MPWGLKNKMVNLHTTTTKVKTNHTIRPLLTHTAPPKAPEEDTEFFCGGEGVIDFPLLHSNRTEVLVEELLLLDQSIENHSIEKISKYD